MHLLDTVNPGTYTISDIKEDLVPRYIVKRLYRLGIRIGNVISKIGSNQYIIDGCERALGDVAKAIYVKQIVE